jgi:hypothetical protein
MNQPEQIENFNDDDTLPVVTLPVGDQEEPTKEKLQATAEKAQFDAQQAEFKKTHEEAVKKYRINTKGDITFQNNKTYLPVTFGHLQELNNELLAAMNVLTKPYYLTPEYFLQVLTSAMHGLKESDGIVTKKQLFGICVKKIAMHVSYDATKEIQDKIRAKAAEEGKPVGTFTDGMTDESDEIAPLPAEPTVPPQEATTNPQ